MYDVFLSYASVEEEQATEFERALEERGLSVWRDRDRIRDLDLIPDSLSKAIEDSRLTVALGSAAHMASNVCRWEILDSLAVGDRRKVDRLRLVMLDGSLHGYSAGARVRRAITVDGSPGSFEHAADDIASNLERIGEPAAHEAPPPSTGLFGVPGHAGRRFVGRLEPMLRVHDVLGSAMRAQDAGVVHRQPVCVVHGMGGVGKSSLALFYAEQFGPSYSAGVLWLAANGDQIDNVADSAASREAVFRSLTESALNWSEARGLSTRTELEKLPADPEGRWHAVRARLGSWLRDGEELLVVVDDVPAGIRLAQVTPPSPRLSVLVTSRDAQPAQGGYESVQLLPFDALEGLQLLAKAVDPDGQLRRRGEDPWHGQESVAKHLVELVGGHPLALDLLTVRLAAGESVQALAAEVADLKDDFLDAPDYFAQLPTAHTPSILATIASSIRGLLGVRLPEAMDLLRLLAVLPAGHAAPLPMVEDVVGEGFRRARALMTGRNVVTADEDGVRCHALTRGVARRLWETRSAPFDDPGFFEPRISLAASTWLHGSSDSKRGKDEVGAASDSRMCLQVLAGVECELGSQQRIQRAESLTALARERYRIPGVRKIADFEEALGWVDEAKAALTPRSSDLEMMAWQSVEAMRGLLLGEACSEVVRPDLALEERLEQRIEAFEICNQADSARKRIAPRLLAQPESETNNHARVRDILHRSMFNLPGRRLLLAKTLAAMTEPDFASVREHLRLMDAGHAELIALRSKLAPVRWADVASSHAGRGSAAYYTAVLGGVSCEEQQVCLHIAWGHLYESLRIRRDDSEASNETDVSKSLALLAKTALAGVCLTTGPQKARDDAFGWLERAKGEVARLSESDYAPGPVDRSGNPVSDVQAYRDARSTTLDRIFKDVGSGGASIEPWRTAGRTAMEWMVVAHDRHSGGRDPHDPLTDFFGTDPRTSESVLLLRTGHLP